MSSRRIDVIGREPTAAQTSDVATVSVVAGEKLSLPRGFSPCPKATSLNDVLADSEILVLLRRPQHYTLVTRDLRKNVVHHIKMRPKLRIGGRQSQHRRVVLLGVKQRLSLQLWLRLELRRLSR